MALEKLSLTFASLAAAYRGGACTAHDVVDEVLARLDRDRDRIKNVWLHVATPGDMHAAVERATARVAAGASLPLFGVPFAVKDNIDVGGVPTTIACPDLAYVPEASAPVVQRLVDAGAIFVGKVNLDQLATGLVGVRSPYGTPTNPFDPRMIPGGSSSGSAVAVAVGHVAFALGTDTAGSGRVPAAFNNVVGLKPSRGVLSTRGVAPACRSLDCVTVFALTVEDAAAVVNVGKSWDALDPFSRIDAQAIPFVPASPATPSACPAPRRLGIPSAETLTFFGDELARAAFDAAVARFRAMNAVVVEIDFRPFLEAGAMLYGGAFVTERLFAGGELVDRKPDALVPVVRDILLGAKAHDGKDVFAALYRLRGLRQTVESAWAVVDALLLPTTPTIYAVEDVLRDPLKLNANLGTYTTFGNLLDLAAIAVPSGFRTDGLPTGIMLVGPRGSEPELLAAGSAYHQAVGGTLGATGHPLAAAVESSSTAVADPYASRAKVAVVGAHLAGQPLNHQLVGLGGLLLRACSTAPKYRLYALRGTVPPKPGLVRVREQGAAIALEVWSLELSAYGAFVAGVGRPLCIGSVELEDGSFVQGFLCESDALAESTDISSYGGWLAYLASKTRN